MEKSFGQVMQEWLYGDQGYYRSAHIGRDFYTAVTLSKLFGGSIARHILSLLDSSALDSSVLESKALSLPLHIIEIGAHHGELMCDVYDFLSALSVGVMEQTRFSIIEPLESLRKKARETIAQRAITQVGTLDEIALDEGESVFIISNELFDAFACELVRIDGDQELLACVCCDGAEAPMSLVWRDLHGLAYGDCAMDSSLESSMRHRARRVREFMQRFGITSGEIPLGWEEFIARICGFASRAKSWRFLSFDYAGLGGAGGGQVFSLRGFFAHRVLGFPEIMQNLPALFTRCDLTYNVDFALLEQIFAAHGARKLFSGRLSTLLVEFGLIALLGELLEHSPSEYRSQSLRARELLAGSLGEKFMGVCFGG